MFAGILIHAACDRREPAPGEVVLYSSVDQPILRPIVTEFEMKTGIKVKLAGDTEATKTTGLVERILLERARPRADVWWSNEALGTVSLDTKGIFEPFTPREETSSLPGRPDIWKSPSNTWRAFALRARVIAFNSERIRREDAPRTLRDFANSSHAGRIGIARPQFGTTRSQMAWVYATRGEAALRLWLSTLRSNRVRIYDGNSSVVRALSVGEIDIGLTDTDDVYAARHQKWPVDHVFEVPDPPGHTASGLSSMGPLVIPNTVARIRNGPNAFAAARLIEFVLSERVEQLMADSEARHFPTRPSLASEYSAYAIPGAPEVDWAAVELSQPAALKACEEILGR